MTPPPRTLTLAVLLPLLIATPGCVSAPARQSPDVAIPLPRQWNTETPPGDSPGRPSWWSTFDDPRLDELVAMALEHNRDLHAAAARLEQAAAQARIAGADLKPSVGAGLSASRRRQNFVGFKLPDGSSLPANTSDSFGVSIETTWEADLWGRLRAGARASVAQWEAAEADLRAARLSIAGQTAKAWFAVLEADQQVELAATSVDSFRAVSEQVRARYEEGLRPALDLRLALSNLSSAEALLEQRSIQRDRAARQLEVLVGRYPSVAMLDTLDGAALPRRPDPVPAGLPSELVARRPDLIAAERRLAAADQRFLQARRALYPRLTLTASGGTSSTELSDLLDGDFRVWSMLGRLLQPIFQGGKLRAGVAGAEAASDEALARYAGHLLRALGEVESALAAESYLARQEQTTAETASQLIAARDLAEERYRSGLGNYLVVLESQTRALTAESTLLAVRRSMLDNRVDLHLALGGGFETAEKTS